MTDNRTVGGLSAAHLVIDLYGPALPAIMSFLILTYGFTYFAAGLLVTVYNVVSSFAQPGIGWLHDRRGMQLPPGLSILIAGVFISLIGIAPGFGARGLVSPFIGQVTRWVFRPSCRS